MSRKYRHTLVGTALALLLGCGADDAPQDAGIQDAFSDTNFRDTFAHDTAPADARLDSPLPLDGSLDDASESDAFVDAATGMPLPAVVDGDRLEGDYEVASGGVSRVNDFDIRGNLTLRQGATLEVENGGRVRGTLRLEAGARIAQQALVGPTVGSVFIVDALVVRGTASEKVVIDGVDWSISFRTSHVDVEYGDFTNLSILPPAGAEEVSGSRIIDTTLRFPARRQPNEVGSIRLFGDVIVHHSEFDNMLLSVGDADVQFNRFHHSYIHIAHHSEAAVFACTGDRDQPQDVVWTNNAMTDVVNDSPRTFLAVGRTYGPLDLSGNYFEERPSDDDIDHADGSTTGCDSRGSWGGPVTLQPYAATEPSAVGVR